MLIVWGASLAFLSVLLGAFGAHGLRERIAPEMLGMYQTGVSYHMAHALALLMLGGNVGRVRWALAAGWLFIFGVLIFSGSLYLLAVTGERRLGAITPIGGLCFLGGWAAVILGALKTPSEPVEGSRLH